ncbi:MAG: glutaredoxin family protein [Myxococcota bacterium]
MTADPAQRIALYQFGSCPYCVRVMDAARRLGIDLPLRDVQRDPERLEELVAATGRRMVPCLRIEEEGGDVRWMHESSDIIAYLEQHFG